MKSDGSREGMLGNTAKSKKDSERAMSNAARKKERPRGNWDFKLYLGGGAGSKGKSRCKKKGILRNGKSNRNKTG